MNPQRPKSASIPPAVSPSASSPKGGASTATSPGQPKVNQRTDSLSRVDPERAQWDQDDDLFDGGEATSAINRSAINRIIDSGSFDPPTDENDIVAENADATSTIDRRALSKIIDAYNAASPSDGKGSDTTSQELNRIIRAHSGTSTPKLPSGLNNPKLPSSQSVPKLSSSQSVPKVPSSQGIPRIMDELDPEAFDGATSTINRSEINRILDHTLSKASAPSPHQEDPSTDTDNFDGATSTINRSEINRILSDQMLSAGQGSSALGSARVSTDPEVPRYEDESLGFSDVTALPLAEVSDPLSQSSEVPQGDNELVRNSSVLSENSRKNDASTISNPSPRAAAAGGRVDRAGEASRVEDVRAPGGIGRTLQLVSGISLAACAVLLAVQGPAAIAGWLLVGAAGLGAALGFLSATSGRASRELLWASATLGGIVVAISGLAWFAEISAMLVPVSLGGALLGLIGAVLRLR